MIRVVSLLIALFTIQIVHSQRDLNLFSFEYTLAPIGNDAIDFEKKAINFNIPLKLNKGVLVQSIRAEEFTIDYNDTHLFSTEAIEEFYRLDYNVAYNYSLGNRWRVTGRAGISLSSNLETSITSEDLLFNGALVFTKSYRKATSYSNLSFGLAYTAFSGRPRVLPVINYNRQVNEKFSFGIGFPNMYAKYTINERSFFKTSLWVNGFYANLSTPLTLDLEKNQAYKASLRTISLAAEYNYKLSDNWFVLLKAGYSFSNQYILLDEDLNEVYEFETASKPFFSTGIRFNLKRKTKKLSND